MQGDFSCHEVYQLGEHGYQVLPFALRKPGQALEKLFHPVRSGICRDILLHIGQPGEVVKVKNKWVSFFLCLFLGYFGAHKFYEGKIGSGILYCFTLGLFGIGWIIDIFNLLNKPNPYYV